MYAFRVLVLCLVVTASLPPLHAQTVVVPETPYSAAPVIVTDRATAAVDADSVVIAYTEGPFVGLEQIGTSKFVVVNLNSGVIEVPAVPLQYGFRVASVAALGANTALIAVRDDNTGGNALGYYFVVNTATGAVTRGPIQFTSSGSGWLNRIAVLDATTVLIAHRGQGRRAKFTVIDPTSGNVKVPEREFDPDQIDTLDVVALDARRVAILYGRPSDVPLPSAFTILDAVTGATLAAPRALPDGLRFFGSAQKLSTSDILFSYVDTNVSSLNFARLNTRTGTASAPTVVSTEALYISSAVLGNNVAFFAYSDLSTGKFVVHDISGPVLIPQTSFNPGGTGIFVASTVVGCRILTAYSDGGDFGRGKVQVRDFSNVCRPVVVDVTANNRQGTIDLRPGDSLQIHLSFDSGTVEFIAPGEVYIGVQSPQGLFWVEPTTLTLVGTATQAFVGPVPSFGPSRLIHVPDVSSLTPGTWSWFMMVDNDENGIPDATFADVVRTIIH